MVPVPPFKINGTDKESSIFFLKFVDILKEDNFIENKKFKSKCCTDYGKDICLHGCHFH